MLANFTNDPKRSAHSDMRKSYNALQEKSSGAQAQYERTVKMLDKIRADNQGKLLELSKLRQELQTLGDRMRTLENKAMEVEKLEIAVETLKKNLETSQQEIRDRERELRRVGDDLVKTEKELEESKLSTVGCQRKNEDLSLQVKEELNRNIQLELRIENADALKEKIEEQKKVIADAKKTAEEKSLIAQHARKCLREEREKNKELEEQTNDIERMVDEVYLLRSENHTLKKLMAAKDKHVVQKTQIISNVRNALQSLPSEEPFLSLLRILDNKDTIPATYANGFSSDEDTSKSERTESHTTKENRRTSHKKHTKSSRNPPTENLSDDREHENISSRTNERSFFLTALDTEKENGSVHSSYQNGYNDDDGVSSKTRQSGKTRSKTGLSRPQMSRETFADFRSETSSVDGESVCEEHVARETNGRSRASRSERSSPSPNSQTSAPELSSRSSSMSRISDIQDSSSSAGNTKPSKTTKSIRMGDRVIVNISKKKDKKKNLQQGVIRYLGDFDGMYGPHKTYVGLKLDEPFGDNEGIILNKRFFRSPARFGKIVPLNRIVSLFDKEAGIYHKVESVSFDDHPQH